MALEKEKLEELHLLLQTLKNAHWLKNGIRFEANFASFKQDIKNHKELQVFIEKLVVEILERIKTIKIK